MYGLEVSSIFGGKMAKLGSNLETVEVEILELGIKNRQNIEFIQIKFTGKFASKKED